MNLLLPSAPTTLNFPKHPKNLHFEPRTFCWQSPHPKVLCVLLEDKKKGGENESFLWKHKHKIYSYESTVKHIFQIFFSRKFCQSPYRLYWFSYVYENHKYPIRVLYPIIRIFIYQTKNFKWYILRSSYTTTEFMLCTFKRSFLCSSTLESSMYIARSKNWKK